MSATFDCTGLTLFAVYQATGILLPHGQGQENYGTLITDPSISQLQVGDVLLFGSSLTNYQHAGIYVGNGYMVDANIAWSPYPGGVQKRAINWETSANPLVGAVRF
jgi:cell wall-associated NlpC family hydrolase